MHFGDFRDRAAVYGSQATDRGRLDNGLFAPRPTSQGYSNHGVDRGDPAGSHDWNILVKFSVQAGLFSLCPDKPKRHLPRNDWELTHAGTQEPAVLHVLARMVSRYKAQGAPLGQRLDREPGQRRVRGPEAVLVSSMRINPLPVSRMTLPVMVIVSASVSKSHQRRPSSSERRSPVAIRTDSDRVDQIMVAAVVRRAQLSQQFPQLVARQSGRPLGRLIGLDRRHVAYRVGPQHIRHDGQRQRAVQDGLGVSGHVCAVRRTHRPQRRVQAGR